MHLQQWCFLTLQDRRDQYFYIVSDVYRSFARCIEDTPSADIYSLFSELGQWIYSFAVSTSSLAASAGNKSVAKSSRQEPPLEFWQSTQLSEKFVPFYRSVVSIFYLFDHELSRNEILQRRQHPQRKMRQTIPMWNSVFIFFFMFAITVTLSFPFRTLFTLSILFLDAHLLRMFLLR